MKNPYFLSLFFSLAVVAQVFAQAPRLVVPVGHTNSIESVAFSPDGKYILTCGDKTAKLWDLSGRELQIFAGYTGSVSSVAFSPDGKTILTGGGDWLVNTVKLWDLAGKELQSFVGHTHIIASVAFSPDGKTILTGSWDGSAKLWDLKGKKLQSFVGHTNWVTSVAFSPDGKTILTGSLDQTARLWDLTGKEIQKYTCSSTVAFSPDGRTILTGNLDKTAKLWDLSGKELQSFVGHTAKVTSVAFSPDGKTILTVGGYGDNSVKLWDLSGQVLQSFVLHDEVIRCVAISPNGKTILTGSNDNTAKLWDLSGKELQSFVGHGSYIKSVAFSPDGQHVLTGGTLTKFWDLSGRGVQSLIGHGSFVNSVAFSPDGKTILTGSDDNTAKLWDLSGKELQSFVGHSREVSSVAFSPDGKTILTGGGYLDQMVKLWDLSGQELLSFVAHSQGLTCMAISPDGNSIVTGSADPDAKLWDLSGRELHSFDHIVPGVSSAAFSPDGNTILTGSSGIIMTAKLWDLSGRELQSFVGHGSFVNAGVFSPDGKIILTGSDDNTAKLWDLSGMELRSFVGHIDNVNSVAFSPNGKVILTGSSDNTSKLWGTQSAKELATLITIDSSDWVVTTPSGLFDASPDAMKLMHYMVGLEVIELEQLKERYYEPGLLAKVMGFDKSGLRDVAVFDQVALYPEVNANIEKNLLSIELTERNGGLGKLSLFINGKEVKEDLNPTRQKKLTVELGTFSKYYRSDAPNTLALRAYNQEGWLKSQAYELTYQPAANARGEDGFKPVKPINPSGRPSLYAIVIGTSNYAGEDLDLSFADQDAEAMSKAFQGACAALFGPERTSVQLLESNSKTSEGASGKANIQKAFQNIAAKARPEDVLLVYFAGHGLAYGPAEKEQFYYLTKDIGSQDLSDPAIRQNYTVSSEELTQWLTAIPAQKQVMVIDACNAGKVVESLATIAQRNLDPSQIRALDRMKDRTGMFILTGSAADKVSYEASQYGQGLLTYSLLQGMSGLALTEDKRVDVMKLFQYSRDAVPDLARGIGGVQTPVLAFPLGEGASFDIGIVNSEVKIPLAQPKPVFIRSIFQDENFGDELELMKALEDYFWRTTLQGASAKLIYSDVSEYESGYSIRGGYAVRSNEVEVKGSLYKGKTLQGKFQVTGKKDDVPGLVMQILGVVMPMAK